MSCLTTSATRRSRIVAAEVRTASAAASSHDVLLVPITSITLYTLMLFSSADKPGRSCGDIAGSRRLNRYCRSCSEMLVQPAEETPTGPCESGTLGYAAEDQSDTSGHKRRRSAAVAGRGRLDRRPLLPDRGCEDLGTGSGRHALGLHLRRRSCLARSLLPAGRASGPVRGQHGPAAAGPRA